jgi:hypothetical protein
VQGQDRKEPDWIAAAQFDPSNLYAVYIKPCPRRHSSLKSYTTHALGALSNLYGTLRM